MIPPWGIDPTTHDAMSERSYHGATSRSSEVMEVLFNPPLTCSVKRFLQIKNIEIKCWLIIDAVSLQKV